MTVLSVVLLAVVGGTIVLAILLLLWPREGKWGINLSAVSCPRCNQPMPRFRKPANQRQALWGGWTCQHCGCEMDKYGIEIANKPGEESGPD